ncbi:MAG: hypothetical protein COU72_04455, partial [Parcubacteria group bacterium CG10_big_fil_rev_8_21_14_0_10_41_35]
MIANGGNVGIGTTNPSSFKLEVAGNVGPEANGTRDLGSATRHWANLYVDNLVGTTVASNEWQRILGALSPRNITDDVLLGATATSSALVKLTGTAGNNSWINTGNVGIGTTNPIQALHVAGQCVTGDTLLKRRRRRKGKNGEWIEEWEDVAIKYIKPGDEILTLDEKTGEFVPQKVEKLMDMGVQEVFLLTTQSNMRIETTDNHPYLVLEKQHASNQKQDKTTVFEIDQSIRIEDMKKDSFVSLASKQKSFTIRLTRADKKILLKRFYKKTPKRFGPENFALTIVFMIHESSYPITKIIIDKEYTNYERLIVSLIQRYYPHLTIVFQSVGKNSPAHEASFFTGLGKHSDSYKKQSQRYFANQEKKIGVSSNLKGFLTAELLHPEFTGIRSPHDLLSPKPYHKILDLSSKTNWVKVKHLKPGMTIATANGWEKISAIIPRGRKQTFDIQVAGTHNFVGNDIVAHNTYISGNVGIGTTAPANKLVVKGDGSSTGLMIGG